MTTKRTPSPLNKFSTRPSAGSTSPPNGACRAASRRRHVPHECLIFFIRAVLGGAAHQAGVVRLASGVSTAPVALVDRDL